MPHYADSGPTNAIPRPTDFVVFLGYARGRRHAGQALLAQLPVPAQLCRLAPDEMARRREAAATAAAKATGGGGPGGWAAARGG